MTREEAINRLMILGDDQACNVLDMIDSNECGFLTAEGDTLWSYYLDAREGAGFDVEGE